MDRAEEHAPALPIDISPPHAALDVGSVHPHVIRRAHVDVLDLQAPVVVTADRGRRRRLERSERKLHVFPAPSDVPDERRTRLPVLLHHRPRRAEIHSIHLLDLPARWREIRVGPVGSAAVKDAVAREVDDAGTVALPHAHHPERAIGCNGEAHDRQSVARPGQRLPARSIKVKESFVRRDVDIVRSVDDRRSDLLAWKIPRDRNAGPRREAPHLGSLRLVLHGGSEEEQLSARRDGRAGRRSVELEPAEPINVDVMRASRYRRSPRAARGRPTR